MKFRTEHERLLQRPVDEETRILSSRYGQIAGLPVLFEQWIYGGIRATSAVFLAEHVASLSDDHLRRLVLHQVEANLSSPTTIVRRAQHVFLNYSFEAD